MPDDITIPFKKYRGLSVRNPVVDDRYLQLLADDFYSDANVPPGKEFPVKVSFELRMAARAELQKRGYNKKGQRWTKY